MKEPTDWASRVQLARGLASEMGEAADQLNDALTQAEAALLSLKLGVYAEVPIYLDLEEGEQDMLIFGKLDGKWRLQVGKASPHSDETYDVMPVVQASRFLRTQAADHLEQLLQRMIDGADKERQRIRDAAQKAAAFSATLGAKAKP